MTSYTPFKLAKPVWALGRETEMNLWLSFRAVAPKCASAILRLTGSAAYEVRLGGDFVAFGPARCAHGFYRVDELELGPLTEDTVVTVTVAGYNINSFYHLDQPSFLTAELFCDSRAIAATGAYTETEFDCRIMDEHMQKVQRYTFQRTFCEVYEVEKDLTAWYKDPAADISPRWYPLVTLVETESKHYRPRSSEYHTYERVDAEKITSRMTFTLDDCSLRTNYPHYILPYSQKWNVHKQFAFGEEEYDSFIFPINLDLHDIQYVDELPTPAELSAGQGVTYKMPYNCSGQLCFTVDCRQDCEIVVNYDEYLNDSGMVGFRSMQSVNVLRWKLKKGRYSLSTFEPYTLGGLHIFAVTGQAVISEVHMRYFGANRVYRRYKGEDPLLQQIFDAAVQSYRQNTFTVYMDCPSRERAGWLCDSFFTSRVEKVLTGKSEVERCFLENFFLPDSFAYLPQGMLPMCYPADHNDGNYIPNWAMWLVLELEEYLYRTGDVAFVEMTKSKIEGLLTFFKRYENADGLLEKLDRWVYVDWSKANDLVQDISFPTNMLYARMLEAAATLYGEDALRTKAAKIKTYIREHTRLSDDFFCDNAVYGEDGEAHLSGIATEACQYYAFFCGVVTPETDPELWQRIVNDFGPERVEKGAWPTLRKEAKWQHISPPNAFIGNYLRLELLYRHGEHERLVNNIRGFFAKMAALTGTLWENETPYASCNHGFASHVLYWMNGLGMIE